jgi:predicted Rossmann fold flavoprotein
VFPESDQASEIIDTLYNYIKRAGVEIILSANVNEIIKENNIVTGVIYNLNSRIECDAVIVATGGVSYPGTGSTGDGYKFARKAGHSIIDPKPSLVPFVVKEEWIGELQGLSLKNIEIQLKKGDFLLFRDFGEMLFTHYGVSGPLILSASRHIPEFNYANIELYIDLKPALTEEKLDDRIKRDFDKYSRKLFINSLDDLLPQKLIPVVVELSQIPKDKVVNQITKEERQGLVNLLKNFKVTPIAPRPIKEAIVTAGGINIKEIMPSTMESRIVSGLYFAGEVIDVDAYTGGFNLTIAFSTGYTAGTSI